MPSYSSIGNATDALGNRTSFAYDANGNQVRVTDPLGVVIDRTFDANNNMLTETTTRLVNGSPQAVVRRFTYDTLNRIVEAVDPEGGVTRITYTATGLDASRTDPLGNTTRFEYDELDRLIRTVHPDGTSDATEYDAEGRKVAATDRAGRTTRFVYDAAGQLVQTTFPDGSTTHATYDAAGQKTSEVDENGNTTAFTYDDAGRTTAIRDPLGSTTRSNYDAAGNRVAQTDRNGRTTRPWCAHHQFHVRRRGEPDRHHVGQRYHGDIRLRRTEPSDEHHPCRRAHDPPLLHVHVGVSQQPHPRGGEHGPQHRLRVRRALPPHGRDDHGARRRPHGAHLCLRLGWEPHEPHGRHRYDRVHV